MPELAGKWLDFGNMSLPTQHLTLARLVDFPTPLTPQNVMTKGLRWPCASMTSLRISTLRLGCRICTSESCRACFTVEATATNTHRHTGFMNMTLTSMVSRLRIWIKKHTFVMWCNRRLAAWMCSWKICRSKKKFSTSCGINVTKNWGWWRPNTIYVYIYIYVYVYIYNVPNKVLAECKF